MNLFLLHSPLRDLYEKVVASERLSEADALRLFESKDLNAVGAIADFARARKVGNRASYILNRYINYSNYCILSCQFCSFARKKRDADGFELTIEQIVQKAREALALGITELHIVGGLHPSLPFSYYTDMLKALRALDAVPRSAAVPAARSGGVPPPGRADPTDPRTGTVREPAGEDACATAASRLQLKCFTAIEILHLAWLAKKSVEQTLLELREAGLDCLTGGGAEIFQPAVRSTIARGKESAEEYLDVHRTWHRLGGRSTCTMLFGHVETLADRVDHLRRLRELQDEALANGFGAGPGRGVHATSAPEHQEQSNSPTPPTVKRAEARAPQPPEGGTPNQAGGFVGFIPLPYQPENNGIPVSTPPTGFDSLRTIAVARAYLDNFDHITAYWVGLGMKLAQVALSYGADDLHGTIVEEHIFHMAGAQTPQLTAQDELVKAIREAGREPVQRDTFYAPVEPAAKTSLSPARPGRN